MSNGYRVEPSTVGQYLGAVESENVKVDQAVQRDFCWTPEMMNALIYSAISRTIYIPAIVLAEEVMDDGTKQTYVVDGGQRTETLFQFKTGRYKITRNIRDHIVTYQSKKKENGKIVRDDKGCPVWETVDFDIRNKTYMDLPDELKRMFDDCSLTTTIYQGCNSDEVSRLVAMYNNHMAMNASQRAFTYLGNFAEYAKRIKDTNRFLIDGTVLTEDEKRKGVWERVISECVMVVNHFDVWKKTSKPMCQYLNDNSSKEEYAQIEGYFNRMEQFSDKLETPRIAALFSSKNLFIWAKVFSVFANTGKADDMFGDFLDAFVDSLQYRNVGGETWAILDDLKNTKDKKTISRKVDYITALMMEYLGVDAEPVEENKEVEVVTVEKTLEPMDVVQIIKEDIMNDVEPEDIEIYESCLNDASEVIEDLDAPILSDENRPALVAVVAHAFKEETDDKLGDWLADFNNRNTTYYFDPKENYLYMKKDFDTYVAARGGVPA